MNTPCDNCPIGEKCWGLKHARYCDLQRTNLAYRNQLFQLAGMTPPPPPVVEAKPLNYTDQRPVLRSGRVVVVSRYCEDVRWVNQLPYQCVIYNKGADIDYIDPVHHVKKMENRGREASTMLQYIVDHYYQLPQWVYFVQGDPHSGDEILGRLTTEYPDTTALTRHYKPEWPPEVYTRHDTIERHGDYEVRYGDARFHGGRDYADNKAWLDALWAAWFTGPQPAPGEWRYAYAAEIAVSKARILARPVEFWQFALARVMAAVNNPQAWDEGTDTAWAMEAIWLYLFDPRYPVVMPEDHDQGEKMPGFFEMAKNFAGSFVKHVKDGFAKASPEVQEARIATCRACPNFKADTEQCRLCGCLCNVKKAWASEVCPIGKWKE